MPNVPGGSGSGGWNNDIWTDQGTGPVVPSGSGAGNSGWSFPPIGPVVPNGSTAAPSWGLPNAGQGRSGTGSPGVGGQPRFNPYQQSSGYGVFGYPQQNPLAQILMQYLGGQQPNYARTDYNPSGQFGNQMGGNTNILAQLLMRLLGGQGY